MPILFDIETDFLYLKGYQKGYEQGFKIGYERGLQIGFKKWENHKNGMLVEKLILESRLNNQQIAKFVEVTEAFVLSIQKHLIKEGKLKSNVLKDK